jgi:hypothetical protein
MKQQDNISPSKGNSTTKDPDTCIEEEVPKNKFKKSNGKND